jgi:NAD(P)-dependent dehydrogenase (short-subunit alcohol dehydrogenase family)
MPITIVTGSGRRIGSESARHLAEHGFDVIGLETDVKLWATVRA